jgi:DNA-binding beta-propeller fold protein YncE
LDAVPFGAAVVSRDGKRAAVAEESPAAVLDVGDHRMLANITFDAARRRALGLGSTDWGPVSDAWSADGSRLFIGMGDPDQGGGTSGAVIVVNAATWQPERRILDSSGGANAMQLSPDGRLLAVGYASGDVALAHADTYRVVHRLHVQGNVRSIAFSPDGSRLAAAWEKRLQVWDVRTGVVRVDQPPYFAGGAVSVAWLPDGHTIVYGGDDGHAVLFDTSPGITRGVPPPVFRDGGGGFVFVAPIGSERLALFPGARPGLATREGVVYSLNPADWLAHACAVADRDVTKAEWTAYIPERRYRRTRGELT